MASTPRPQPSDEGARSLKIETEPGRPTLVETVVTVSSPRRAVVTVLAGPDVGRVLDLSGSLSVTFGRRSSCTFKIEDPSVSGIHARITASGNLFVISDEGSTNGVLLNGVRLAEPTHLTDGDRVHLGRVLLRFALVDEVERMGMKRMYDAALRDTLTNLFNRKHLDERIDAEIAFARRHKGHELSVIMLDIDHFKSVNDTYGHLAGDAVLMAVAAALVATVRAEDFVARYGGEEFVIVARDVSAKAACTLAERVRQTIAQGVVTYDGKRIKVTASAGVAALVEGPEQRDKAGLLASADKRLYEAKRSGRNRVVGPP